MRSNLDKLLGEIDPVNTYDVVSSRVDSALISFKVKSGIIDDWNEFGELLARFFRHTQNKILNIHNFCPKDKSFDLGGSVYILKKEYISKHGHLLPSELVEGSAVRIRMFFIKVLEEHPRLIKNLRKLHSNKPAI